MFFLPQNFYQYFFLFSLYEVSSLKKKKKNSAWFPFDRSTIDSIYTVWNTTESMNGKKKKMKYVGACKRCICTAKSVYNVSSSE